MNEWTDIWSRSYVAELFTTTTVAASVEEAATATLQRQWTHRNYAGRRHQRRIGGVRKNLRWEEQTMAEGRVEEGIRREERRDRKVDGRTTSLNRK